MVLSSSSGVVTFLLKEMILGNLWLIWRGTYDLWVSKSEWIGLRWQEKNYEWEEFQDGTWQYSRRHSGGTRRQWMWRCWRRGRQRGRGSWAGSRHVATGMQDEVVIHTCYGWHVGAGIQDEVVIHSWYGWFFDDTKTQFPHLSSMVRLFSSVGFVKSLVVTSGLTSAWRQLTSGLRSPDEADEAAGSITRLRFVWFSSNFVHLPPRKALEKRVYHAPHFLQFFNPRILADGKADEKWEMMGNSKRHTEDSHNCTWATDRSGTTPQYNVCGRPGQETLWRLGQRAS